QRELRSFRMRKGDGSEYVGTCRGVWPRGVQEHLARWCILRSTRGGPPSTEAREGGIRVMVGEAITTRTDAPRIRRFETVHPGWKMHGGKTPSRRSRHIKPVSRIDRMMVDPYL